MGVYTEHLNKGLEKYVEWKFNEGVEEGLYRFVDDWQWRDEGLIWAIQEYYSHRGEFSEKDIKYLNRYGFDEEDFIDDDF